MLGAKYHVLISVWLAISLKILLRSILTVSNRVLSLIISIPKPAPRQFAGLFFSFRMETNAHPSFNQASAQQLLCNSSQARPAAESNKLSPQSSLICCLQEITARLRNCFDRMFRTLNKIDKRYVC